MRCCPLLALILLLGPAIASANSIIPPPWELIVADADFIGVVQCEQAGGIVAKYRVLDSWKGPRKGSEILIGRRVDEFGEAYPLALCGEKYFFTATRFSGNSVAPLVTMGSQLSEPVWWRTVLPDYYASWWPAKIPAPCNECANGVLEFGPEGSATTVESFRPHVRSFLTTDEDLLELRELRAAATWPYLGTMAENERSGMAHRIQSATRSDSTEVVIQDLLLCAAEAPYAVSVVLGTGGRAHALRRLESIPQDSRIFGQAKLLRAAIDGIKRRLGLTTTLLPEPAPSNLSASEALAILRAEAPDPMHRNLISAIKLLTGAAPESVRLFLLGWHAPRSSLADSSLAYDVASYFSWRCPEPRAERLRSLLSSPEPFVQVAGAVYLRYEDDAAGKGALDSLLALPGDPGVWAALTLARSGDKNALPRALEVLKERGPYTMDGERHRLFRGRVIELLSNSAFRSGLRLPLDWNPDQWPDSDPPDLYERYRSWWQSNESKIQLGDPWLPALTAAKVD